MDEYKGRMSDNATKLMKQLQKGIWESAEELFSAKARELRDDEKKIILIEAHPTDPAWEIADRVMEAARLLVTACKDHANSLTEPASEAVQTMHKILSEYGR